MGEYWSIDRKIMNSRDFLRITKLHCKTMKHWQYPLVGWDRGWWWDNIVEQNLAATHPPSPSPDNSLWDNISLLVIISSECLGGNSRREPRAICNNWIWGWSRIPDGWQWRIRIKDWENNSSEPPAATGVGRCVQRQLSRVRTPNIRVTIGARTLQPPSCRPLVPLIAMHKSIGKWSACFVCTLVKMLFSQQRVQHI